MLIPISGKPGDLDLDEIKNASDADRVLLWLSAVLRDMATQVSDRGANPDPEWLRKLRAAQRATTNLRHRVLETRDSFSNKMSVHEAIASAVVSVLDDKALTAISAWIEESSPHLTGLDLKALAKDQLA